ncbi:MAG: lamin tail domain-containing protein [candidate division WOR-3 bacterium]|nr:lamin tail domain-containing protein [candidate division WOR-3 bacterium]
MGITLLLTLLAASRIVITEVMANPAGISGAHMPEDRNEFVELYNPTESAIDLYGWTINDGDAVDQLTKWTDTTILTEDPSLRINQTWLAPHHFAVVLDPEYTDPAPTGGFVMPYHFGDSALILTVGNTTIGNGLATTDPVTVYSPYGDTSTFGTPADPTDSIPCDAGDGISWERIDVLGPDTFSNWMACRDAAGCTPGDSNSALTFLDLAVTGIALTDSTTAKPGEPLLVSITVANSGFRVTEAWSLTVFLDRNGNSRNDPDEDSAVFQGTNIPAGNDTAFSVRLACPAAKTDLWAKLTCVGDGDSTNNSMRLTIVPGGSERMFDLNLSSFSPDGDGFEESLAVLYHLPEAKGTLKITVFNLGGKPVATLFSGRPPDVRGAVCWDGRNSTGARAPIGIYAVCVEYRAGAATRSEKLPVVLLRK